MAKIKTETKPLRDNYQTITDAVIASLEKGVVPWRQPWDNAPGQSTNPLVQVRLPMRVNGKSYRGINVFTLWMASLEAGYTASHWMTFNQCKALGGNVRKGQKGTAIVFSSRIVKSVENEGVSETRTLSFLRSYTVFNADQCENLPERFRATPPVVSTPVTVTKTSEAPVLFEHHRPDVRQTNRAVYHPKLDYIEMPPLTAFETEESYKAVLAHEMVHWTGAEHRLNRTLSTDNASRDYAKEELVGELGSAFICAELGLAPNLLENTASYIAGWIKALRNDKRLIISAASKAQAATDFLLNRAEEKEDGQPGEQVEEASSGLAMAA